MRKMLTNRFTKFITWFLTIAVITLSVPLDAFAFKQETDRSRAERRAMAARERLNEKQAMSQSQHIADTRLIHHMLI